MEYISNSTPVQALEMRVIFHCSACHLRDLLLGTVTAQLLYPASKLAAAHRPAAKPQP